MSGRFNSLKEYNQSKLDYMATFKRFLELKGHAGTGIEEQMKTLKLMQILEDTTPDNVMDVNFDDVDVEDAKYAKWDAEAYQVMPKVLEQLSKKTEPTELKELLKLSK